MPHVFVELPEFTQRIVKLGLEEDPRQLQLRLDDHPRTGIVEPGTCGVRKIRMTDSARGEGSRGGARVHYVYFSQLMRIYLMWVYTKAEQGSLSPAQRKMLCRWIRTLEAE